MRGKHQEQLPGVEVGIPELEELAFEYASLRDRRMEFTREEADLKKRALETMRRFDKMEYRVEGLLIKRVLGEEKLKVTVTREDEDEVELGADNVVDAEFGEGDVA
jgi:hypothetical protein